MLSIIFAFLLLAICCLIFAGALALKGKNYGPFLLAGFVLSVYAWLFAANL